MVLINVGNCSKENKNRLSSWKPRVIFKRWNQPDKKSAVNNKVLNSVVKL